jgi:Protein of unknown function (DUF2637)
MQDILPDSRAVRHGTTAVLLVAVIAAIVSFVHIEHLAVTHGQTQLAAYLLPVSIDGTVAACSLVMLRAARLGLPTPVLARVMLGLSVAATLAANIAYCARFGVTGALLSGWPAVAFVGSAELSIGMVRRTRRAVPDAVPAPVPAGGTDTAETVPVDVPADVPADVPIPRLPDAPAAAPHRARRAPKSVLVAVPDAPKSVAERAQDRYAEHIISGAPVPSLRTVMAELHFGQDKARQARAHLVTLAPMNGHPPA